MDKRNIMIRGTPPKTPKKQSVLDSVKDKFNQLTGLTLHLSADKRAVKSIHKLNKMSEDMTPSGKSTARESAGKISKLPTVGQLSIKKKYRPPTGHTAITKILPTNINPNPDPKRHRQQQKICKDLSEQKPDRRSCSRVRKNIENVIEMERSKIQIQNNIQTKLRQITLCLTLNSKNQLEAYDSKDISTHIQAAGTTKTICSDPLIPDAPAIVLEVSSFQGQQIEESILVPKENNTQQNRWEILQLIGGGSTSEVFKVLDHNTGKIVAGKKMVFLDAETEKIIFREISILCNLKHPNIVQYYGTSKKENQVWIYMQYIPETLQNLYKECESMSIETIKTYAKQLVSALNYLHQLKIIHKDIKCSNILVDKHGHLKLSDFGSSKRFDQSTSEAACLANGPFTFKGSVLWMAPEAVTQSKYGRKSDVWSLGCSILELTTKKVPWHHKDFDNEWMAMYVIGKSEQIPQIPAIFPEKLRQFLLKCLVRNPEHRSTCQQLLQSRFLID